MEAVAITTDSCPTCGTSISQARLAEIRKRLDSEQRKLQSTMRAELALEHKQALEEREAELRRDLIAEAEREKEAALARQRKLLEGERNSAKTELANVRSELDHARSRFEQDLAAANGRAAKLEQERSDWNKQETERIEALVKAASAEECASLVRERDEARTQQAQIKAVAEEREAELRRDLTAAAEREKELALARQRELLEGERDSAKMELANVRSELDRTRSKFEENLAAASGRVATLEQERADWSMQETKRIEALVKVASAEEHASLARERDEARTQQAQIKVEAEAREADHKKEISRLREVLEKDKERALAVKDSEAAIVRESLKQEVADLTRKLEQQTANQLGDGGEIDLYEELREAFPSDRITRIQKGLPGADIRHQVLHGGEVCGTILYDSKNHKAWRTGFAEKLKADQTEEKADYAILSTLRFPQGEQHITTINDVVVSGPRHVAHIAWLMRRSIVSMHIQGLSLRDRNGKQQELYKLITSNLFRQQMEEIERLNDQIAEVDVAEQAQHRRTWKTRGTLTTRQKHVLMDVVVGINSIIEGTTHDEHA